MYGWIFRLGSEQIPLSEIQSSAIRSVALDPGDAKAHQTAAFAYFFDKKLDLFEKEASVALELAPNDAEILARLGFLFASSGQYERGVPLASKAHSLNALTAGGWYYSALYYDFFRSSQYRKALEANRSNPSQHLLEQRTKYVAVYGQLGEVSKAKEAWADCVALDAEFSVGKVVARLKLWNQPESMIERFVEGYSKAGFPLEE
jgi:tetratricopeptide (TPR) repeat protein